jgi:hypothetical protein
MIAKKLIVATLFAAFALVTTAAGSAQAEDQRWNPGRSQWQPQTHSGWFDNNRDWNSRDGDRNRNWDRDRNAARERDAWSRRNDDHNWRGRQDRWEHDRGRHEGWRRHDRDRDRSWN